MPRARRATGATSNEHDFDYDYDHGAAATPSAALRRRPGSDAVIGSRGHGSTSLL